MLKEAFEVPYFCFNVLHEVFGQYSKKAVSCPLTSLGSSYAPLGIRALQAERNQLNPKAHDDNNPGRSLVGL